MYKSLISTICSLYEQKPVETDQNDQISVGSYTTKSFEMSRPAQKLYAHLPKNTDPNVAEKAAIHLDRLFDIDKKVTASGRATPTDYETAKKHADFAKKHAREMNLEKEHSFIDKHVNNIQKHLGKDDDHIIDAKDVKHPVDSKRFKTPEHQQNPIGPRNDRDIDNLKRYLLSRSRKAQNKIKIIDD